MALIAAFFFLLVILPLLKRAIDFNVLRIRRETCVSLLEASLPAAYRAISTEQLSLGNLALDQAQARSQIEQLLRRNMADARLSARLQGLNITFATVSRPEASSHWLSGNRPDVMPVISATAEWIFSDGWTCRIDDRIELVLD